MLVEKRCADRDIEDTVDCTSLEDMKKRRMVDGSVERETGPSLGLSGSFDFSRVYDLRNKRGSQIQRT
jgi:hypothetical protein